MKKNLRKFLAMLTCFVLIFSMTVFAADSPSTDTINPGTGNNSGTNSPDTENNSGINSPDTENNSGTNSPDTEDNSGINSPDTEDNSGNGSSGMGDKPGNNSSGMGAGSEINSPDTEDNSGTNGSNTENNTGNSTGSTGQTAGNETGSIVNISSETTQILNSTYANGVSVSKVVEVNGASRVVNVIITDVNEAIFNLANEQARAFVGAQAEVLKIFDVKVEGLTDEEIKSGVRVTMNVPGVTEGQRLAVLHQKADGTWESLSGVKVGNGTVSAIFTSFSPVAIVSVAASAATGAEFPLGIVVMFVVAIAGAGFCMYKRSVTE